MVSSRLNVRLSEELKASDAKEIFVREENERSHLHLGVLALEYGSEDCAKQIAGELGKSGDPPR